MKYALLLLGAFCIFSFKATTSNDWRTAASNPDAAHLAIKRITDVMVHDIYSPPVASRTYAYISVAGYEAARHANKSLRSLAGQLNGLSPVPQPMAGKVYSFELAAVTAILTVGKTLVVSEGDVDVYLQKQWLAFKQTGMPAEVLEASIGYGKDVAAHILAWAATDNYKQTRSFPRYEVVAEDGRWTPTPPAYIKAVEPHWSQIRPFLMDSAEQFKPRVATTFSTEEKSLFYKEAKEVHDIGLKLSEDQKLIANFWDCNPFKMNINGHVMFATKKISPGGHWINITALACRSAKTDFAHSMEAYAITSLAIADGFISCWNEKYRSNVTRPETYINQHLSQSWRPLLQTPPFPEYTSGHSVISTAAALVLTKLFGNSFAFADDTEVEFGLPVRRFSSFKQAAAEAAISRLYGGIHYRPAIEQGVKQGEQIGRHFLAKLHTR